MSLRLAVHRHKSAALVVAELQLMRRLCADSGIQNRYMGSLLKRALEMSAQALADSLESHMIYLHFHRVNNVRFLFGRCALGSADPPFRCRTMI